MAWMLLPQSHPNLRSSGPTDDWLIAVTARIACHGRGHITMHLPEDIHGWMNLFEATCSISYPKRPRLPRAAAAALASLRDRRAPPISLSVDAAEQHVWPYPAECWRRYPC